MKWLKNWLTSSNSQRKAERDLHGKSKKILYFDNGVWMYPEEYDLRKRETDAKKPKEL